MIRFFLVAVIAFILVLLHALPFAPRPNRLFGVAVPREIRYGNEGRLALRQYELRLLPWTAAALAASLWLPLPWAALWMTAATVIPLYASLWIFARRRAGIRHLALPAPSTREAPLTDVGDGLFRQALPFALPLALLAATAQYLHVHWERIPARYPIHWGADGMPNGWSARTFAGVYGPLLIGAITVLFIAGTSVLSSWGSRRSARSPVFGVIQATVAWLLAIGFSIAGLLPLRIVPAGALPVLVIVFLVFQAVMVWVSLLRSSKADSGVGEATPDACWHGDLFYSNRNDPALFVEKRIGIGQMLNFGNRLSWFILALLLLIPLGLVFLASEFTKG
jgi:uncharacterized membrane protein